MDLVRKYILKTGIKYGVTGGIVITLFYTVLLILNKNIFIPALLLLAGLMIILIIFFSMLEYNQIDLQPRFWKNMSVGLICNFLISVVFILLMFVILNWVKPELRREYIDDRVAMMMEYKETYIEKFSEEHFNILLNDVKTTSPTALALDGPIKLLLSGLFFTILIGLIFYLIKNKKSPQEKVVQSNGQNR